MRKPIRDERPELLALRALKLGDLLVAVPALRGLRRAFPEHRIIYAGPPWLWPLVQLTSSVDELLPAAGVDCPLPLQPGRIDVAVNLHGNGAQSRSLLEALRPARRIGHRALDWDGPLWREGIHERVRWTQLLEAHGIAADPNEYCLLHPAMEAVAPGAAVLHVGAAYGSRLWPVERFAAVAAALAGLGRKVVFTGSAAERPRALETAGLARLPMDSVLAGTLSLQEFAAVIADAEIVISADTGAAHLAAAYRRQSVVIFGPAPVEEWGPPPGPHIALTDASLRRGDVFSQTPDPALLAVSAADVLAAARSLGVY